MQPSKDSHHSGRKPTPNILGETAMEELIGASNLRRPDPSTGRPPEDKPSATYSQPSDGLLAPATQAPSHDQPDTNQMPAASAGSEDDISSRLHTSTEISASEGAPKLKQTHYLDPDTIDRLDEVIHALRRHARKGNRRPANSSMTAPRVNLSKFIELAVTLALDDFERYGVESVIAQRLLNGSAL
jgi:hypothetical protein